MRLKLRIALMFLLLAVLFCGLVFWMRPKKEPLYEGKPLSEWLSVYYIYPTSVAPLMNPTQSSADKAFREAGTNAIPYLMEMLQAHNAPLKMRFYQWADKRTLFGRHWHYKLAQEKVLQAMRGFQALGPQRTSLIPQLKKIYDQCPNPFCRQAIVAIVTYVAPQDEKSLMLLALAITQTNDFILNVDAVAALGELQIRNDLIVPMLTNGLAHPDPFVQQAAAWALFDRGTNAGSAVPALIKLIKDPKTKSTGHDRMVFGSGQFTFADSATVKSNLVKRSLPDPNVRFAAIKALESIDPDTAGKLEAQKN